MFITLVILLARRARRRGKDSGTTMSATDGGAVHILSRPDALDGEPEASPPPSAVQIGAEAGTVDETLTVDEIGKRIDRAVAAGDRLALSGLYLALARAHHRGGDGAARMQALRSAAGYGALHGPRAAHAAARLELAEVAYDAGDLTSACEQWQLARSAFLEDGATAEHAAVDKRMRDNGCPTDWVLTDF